MSEDLIERLEHFEQHQKDVGDQYGAEVLFRAKEKIEELRADKERLDWLEERGTVQIEAFLVGSYVIDDEHTGGSLREAIDEARKDQE